MAVQSIAVGTKLSSELSVVDVLVDVSVSYHSTENEADAVSEDPESEDSEYELSLLSLPQLDMRIMNGKKIKKQNKIWDIANTVLIIIGTYFGINFGKQ